MSLMSSISEMSLMSEISYDILERSQPYMIMVKVMNLLSATCLFYC